MGVSPSAQSREAHLITLLLPDQPMRPKPTSPSSFSYLVIGSSHRFLTVAPLPAHLPHQVAFPPLPKWHRPVISSLVTETHSISTTGEKLPPSATLLPASGPIKLALRAPHTWPHAIPAPSPSPPCSVHCIDVFEAPLLPSFVTGPIHSPRRPHSPTMRSSTSPSSSWSHRDEEPRTRAPDVANSVERVVHPRSLVSKPPLVHRACTESRRFQYRTNSEKSRFYTKALISFDNFHFSPWFCIKIQNHPAILPFHP
jgi:hypothetical protein